MKDELLEVLDEIGDSHRVSNIGVLKKAANIYQHYYGKYIKPGCSSCNLTILNGLKNVINFAKIPTVTDEVFEERNSICVECPNHWDITNQCGKCKCFLKWKNKLPGEECPVGKWKAV